MLYPIRYIFIVVFVFITSAATVSAQTNGITVAWDPNDPAEQVAEYRLYYKTGNSGPPYNGVGLNQGNSPIIILVNDLADEDNPEYALTGLSAGVTYRFAITAYNGAESRYSAEVSYLSQEPADLDHVKIEGPTTIPDNNTAQLTLRAYFNNNTDSQVNASSWELIHPDADISSTGLITAEDVTADTQGMVSARYSSEGITRSDQVDITIEDTSAFTLDHIEIDGPGSVDENSSANYNCIAHYTNGRSEQVAAESWSEDCPETNISINGVLNTGEVNENVQCTISAMYLSQFNEIDINIRDNTTTVTLTRVDIEGPDGVDPPNSVDEGSSTTLTCRAYYSDGTNQIVTPDSWAITTGASLARITSQGVLNAYEVSTDGTVGIIASHTVGQSTRSDEIQVIVNDTDTSPPSSPSEIIMDNGDPGTSYKSKKWKTSADESFGKYSEFCKRSGQTYSFTTATRLDGDYEVWFRWTERGNNKKLPVKIYNGDTFIEKVRVNQKINRGQWNLLGKYTFSGLARVKVVTKKGTTSVDGMRFTRQ